MTASKLIFQKRNVCRGEPLDFSVLSSSPGAEFEVYTVSDGNFSPLYKAVHSPQQADGVFRSDATLDTSLLPLGETRFILTEKGNPTAIRDLVRVYIDKHPAPDWVRDARIIEFVAGALMTQREAPLTQERIEELWAGMPDEAERINANVIWVDGHYPFPIDRVETELDRTGQCGNAIFPYEHYAEAAFDIEGMLARAHEKGMRVVTYMDPAGVLTTTADAASYAKLDVFGNRQSHWPWIAYATCPNNPDWQEYILEEARGVMEFGFDGIFFDDANRPLHAMPCYCEHCKSEFRERFKQEPPRYPGEKYWQQWCQMPFDAMAGLVARVRDVMKEFGDDKVVASNANLMLWPELAAAEDCHVSDFPGTADDPVPYLKNAAELYGDAQGKAIWLGHYYIPNVEHYSRALALNLSMRSCTKIQYHFDYDELSSGNPELADLIAGFFGFWESHKELYTAQDHDLLPGFNLQGLPASLFSTTFEQWQKSGEKTTYVHLAAHDLEKQKLGRLELPLDAGDVLEARLLTLDGDRQLKCKRGSEGRARLSGFSFRNYAVLEIRTKGLRSS